MTRRLGHLICSLAILAGLNARLFAAGNFAVDFDSANKLCEQGKFTEAASAYEKLVESGRVSAALYFNLGNAFFKSGRIGRAIAAYRQAERIAPRDPDLRANLQFVRNQVPGPTLLPGRWQRSLGALSLDEWTGLAALAFWLWLLLLATVQCRPAWKLPLRTPAVVCGVGAAALCVCLGAALLTDSSDTAVVITREASVRNGPLDESQSAFSVHDGAEIEVLDKKDDWLQVSAGDRRVGWVKRAQVLLPPK